MNLNILKIPLSAVVSNNICSGEKFQVSTNNAFELP